MTEGIASENRRVRAGRQENSQMQMRNPAALPFGDPMDEGKTLTAESIQEVIPGSRPISGGRWAIPEGQGEGHARMDPEGIDIDGVQKGPVTAKGGR
jgi:hypothetical protein